MIRMGQNLGFFTRLILKYFETVQHIRDAFATRFGTVGALFRGFGVLLSRLGSVAVLVGAGLVRLEVF